jgi:hypothetical protein
MAGPLSLFMSVGKKKDRNWKGGREVFSVSRYDGATIQQSRTAASQSSPRPLCAREREREREVVGHLDPEVDSGCCVEYRWTLSGRNRCCMLSFLSLLRSSERRTDDSPEIDRPGSAPTPRHFSLSLSFFFLSLSLSLSLSLYT